MAAKLIAQRGEAVLWHLAAENGGGVVAPAIAISGYLKRSGKAAKAINVSAAKKSK
jgi:hypothetical protein